MGKRTLTLTFVLTLTLHFVSMLTACGSDDEEKPSNQNNAGADCTGLCNRITPLGCANGPPSAELCALVCQGILDGDDATCKAAMRSLLDCVKPASQISCDADGNFTSPDCAAQWHAVVPCLPAI